MIMRFNLFLFIQSITVINSSEKTSSIVKIDKSYSHLLFIYTDIYCR